MEMNISELSVKKTSLLFLDKLETYISIMEKFMTPEEIEKRKEELSSEFNDLIYDFYLLQEEVNPNGITSVEISPDQEKKMVRYSRLKKKIENIVSSEVGFVNFITTNFETDDIGVTFRSEDGVLHHEGINKALTYSIINTIALLKQKNNEPFEYPEEMEPSDEMSLFQIKDSISIDMMDIFGDDVIKHFFLGEGEKFNKELRHLFVIDATTDKDVETEMIAVKALYNMKEFEEGVEGSIKRNDETYYGNYSRLINKFKEISKSIDLKQIDENDQIMSKGLK